jgi:hypothetical protein
MANSNTTTSVGIGFCVILFIVFLTLKITNNIDWSWWLIALPLWWWIGLIIIGVILFVLFWFISILIRSIKKLITIK